MPKSKPVVDLRPALLAHVLITDHLQNLHRAHGDVEVDPVCSCGAVLGRVVLGAPTCQKCGHERGEHRKPGQGGCQAVVTQVRTVPQTDDAGTLTGRTVDVVERAVCDCEEFRALPTGLPKRADLIDTWLKHAGLPDVPVRDHLLLRIVGTYVPPDKGPAAPAIAHCLCGEHLIAEGSDVTDPMAAIGAWAEHIQADVEARR